MNDRLSFSLFFSNTVSSSSSLLFVLLFLAMRVELCGWLWLLLRFSLYHLNEKNKNRSRTRYFIVLVVRWCCFSVDTIISQANHIRCLSLFLGQWEWMYKNKREISKTKKLWSYITTPETPTFLLRMCVSVCACVYLYSFLLITNKFHNHADYNSKIIEIKK